MQTIENTSSEVERSPAVRVERVGLEQLSVIRDLNRTIFGEDHIINSFDHDDLVMLLAVAVEGPGGSTPPVGFKIGYRMSEDVFYSAKGGVHPDWRRGGVARLLLHDLQARVGRLGYTRFAYDTFPNKHPGMTVLGLAEGFEVTRAGYSARYEDYRLRFEKQLGS